MPASLLRRTLPAGASTFNRAHLMINYDLLGIRTALSSVSAAFTESGRPRSAYYLWNLVSKETRRAQCLSAFSQAEKERAALGGKGL